MSKLSDGMAWFKGQFADRIQAGIEGTPFTVDFLTAIATQETFSIWGSIYKTLSTDEVLKLCVGDTLDGLTGFELGLDHIETMLFVIANLLGYRVNDGRQVRMQQSEPDSICRPCNVRRYYERGG